MSFRGSRNASPESIGQRHVTWIPGSMLRIARE